MHGASVLIALSSRSLPFTLVWRSRKDEPRNVGRTKPGKEGRTGFLHPVVGFGCVVNMHKEPADLWLHASCFASAGAAGRGARSASDYSRAPKKRRPADNGAPTGHRQYCLRCRHCLHGRAVAARLPLPALPAAHVTIANFAPSFCIC